MSYHYQVIHPHEDTQYFNTMKDARAYAICKPATQIFIVVEDHIGQDATEITVHVPSM